jgi:hypothetical protein
MLTLMITTDLQMISVDLDGSATQYEVDAPGVCAFKINASMSILHAFPMWTVATMNCATVPPNKNLILTN